MSTALRPFRPGDVSAAGDLLADRHRRHRSTSPLLDPAFEDPEQARAQVAALWSQSQVGGAVAERDGRVQGYLLGTTKTASVWGANVWVEAAGSAGDDPELVRDLYAFAAQPWVDAGLTCHYAVVPADDPSVVDAWARLGFGQQQLHAARPLPGPADPAPAVRRAGTDDLEALAALDLVLPTHQARAPVFSSGPVPSLAESRGEWVEALADDRVAGFVAVEAGRVVGSALGCSVGRSSANSGLVAPLDAGLLAYAAVLPEARGRGHGRRLGEAVMQWVRSAGFASVACDWRVTNLTSSRAWPALGFAPTFVRMHRVVGH